MKVLVIGSGAREHAMTWTLVNERPPVSVVCAPGNPGISALAQCISADVTKPHELLAIALRERVDVTLVGPEVPLSLGIVDLFAASSQPIVGPSRAAASLESSKAFAKDFMARHRIPTARFRTVDSADEAMAFVDRSEFGYPLVIKADGLAAGKGVVIAEDALTAADAVRHVMIDRTFGDAGERVVFEEFLTGEEASYFVLSDGSSCMPLLSAQDHKRIYDGDRGPNTGGMGAFAPSPLVTSGVEERVLTEIVEPVLAGMRAEGNPYKGFLYVGLMLTASGPKVIEFNVRFGDPEAQVVLPMLGEPLSNLLVAAAAGTLPQRPASFRNEPHVGVVVAAGGYPESSETGKTINGVDAASAVEGAIVFHAGTAHRDGHLVTAGGRVLTVVGRGPTHRDARETAYKAAAHIQFQGMQMRRDIGNKALAIGR
jgi:phosphoribosylamine--glycine ligase